jgi:simple sugar transport system permease protein
VRTIFGLPSPERDQKRQRKARAKQLQAEAGTVVK